MEEIDDLLTDFYGKYSDEPLTDEKRATIKKTYGDDNRTLIKDLYKKYNKEDVADEKMAKIYETYGLSKPKDPGQAVANDTEEKPNDANIPAPENIPKEQANDGSEEKPKQSRLEDAVEYTKNMFKVKMKQGGDILQHLKVGSAETGAGLAGIPNFINKIKFSATAAIADMVGVEGADQWEERINELPPEQREDFINKMNRLQSPIDGIIGTVSTMEQNYLTELSDELSAKTVQYEGNILDDVAAGRMDQAAARVANGLAGSAPSLVLAAAPGGILAIGAGSASQKQERLEAEGEKLDASSILNSAVTGTAEGAFEAVTAGLLKPLKGVLKGKRGMADEFAKNFYVKTLAAMGMEGGSEGGTEIIQQLSDDFFKGEDPEKTSMDFWKNVGDAFLVGSLMGGGISVATLGAARVMPEATKKQAKEADEAVKNIDRDLEKPIPDTIREELEDSKKSIVDAKESLIQSEYETFKAMPKETRQKFGDLEKQLDDIKLKHDQIRDNPDISETTKEMLLKKKVGEAKTLLDEKQKLREDFDSAPVAEKKSDYVAEPAKKTTNETEQVKDSADTQKSEADTATDTKTEAPKPKSYSLGKKGGSYTVEKVENGLNITNAKGEVPSAPTVRKVQRKYAKDFDFTKGELSNIPQGFQGNPAVFIAENSNNPLEIAEQLAAIDTEEYLKGSVDFKSRIIAENIANAVEKTSYTERFGDRNNVGNNMARSYFSEKGKGQGIDQLARDLSTDHGIKIEPKDIVAHMEKYTGGENDLYKDIRENEIYPLREAFTKLTGLPGTSEYVNIAESQWQQINDGAKALYGLSEENLISLDNERQNFADETIGKDASKGSDAQPRQEPSGKEDSGKDGDKPGVQGPRGEGAETAADPKVEAKEKGKPEQDLSGIKKDLIPDKVSEEISIERRTVQEVLDKGMEMVESGQIDPPNMVKALMKQPRPLKAEETAALVYYKRMLDNDKIDNSDRLIKAYEKGDPSEISILEEEMRGIDLATDNYHVMQTKTRYEEGLGFYVQRMLINNEYELARQIVKLRANNKGVMPKEALLRFKQYDKQLKEINDKIKKLEAEKEAGFENIEPLRKKKYVFNKLSKSETAEKNALRKELFGGKLFDITSMAALAVNPKMYRYATLVLREAGGDFERFSDRLLEEVGEGFKKYLPDLYEKALARSQKSKEPGTPTVDEDGILRVPNSLIKNLIADGFDTIESLTEEVHRLVKDAYPEIDIRQVRDVITNYGKTVNLSKEEIDVKLREMRRTGRLLSSLEDANAKISPKRSGLQRDKPTEKQRRLQRAVKEAMKDIPQSEESLKQDWASALDAAKTRFKNLIEDLEQQIKTGERPKKGKPLELDAEALALKQQVTELREVLDSQLGRANISDEQRIKAAIAQVEKTIEIYQAKIKEKNFEALNSNPVPETPKLKKAREELKATKKEYEKLRNENTPESAKQEKANEKRLKYLLNREQKLSKRIQDGEIEIKRKTLKAEETPQITAAENRIGTLNETLQKMKEEAGIVERKKIELYRKNLQRSIDDYTQRIENKDFAPRPVKSKLKKVDAEIRRLEIEKRRWKEKFDIEQLKYRLANRTKAEKLADLFIETANAPRTLMASADVSAMLRQGFILGTRNPRAAGRAFVTMWKHAFNQEAHDNWLRELQETDMYVLMKESKLYISEPTSDLKAREEEFIAKNVLKHVPWLGFSERTYVGYLNKLRTDIFANFADGLIKKGYDPRNEKDLKTFRDFAEFINNASGRGSLGKPDSILEKAAPMLSAMFFSPRYAVSRLQMLNPVKYYKMDGPVRMEALKTGLTFMGTGMTILTLAAAAGAEVEDDPRSSDFGKIKFGDYRYDVWAGQQQWVRFLAQLAMGQRKSIKTGEVVTFDPDAYAGSTRLTVLMTFLRGKLAPIPATIINGLAGKNLIGERFELSEAALSLVLPLYVGDFLKLHEEGGEIDDYAKIFFSNFFGIGVGRYNLEDMKSAKKEMKKEPEFGSLR